MRTFSSAVSEKPAIFDWAPAPYCSTTWEFVMSICFEKASTCARSSSVSESSSAGALGSGTSMMVAWATVSASGEMTGVRVSSGTGAATFSAASAASGAWGFCSVIGRSFRSGCRRGFP